MISFRQWINEGGNAIAGVSRINQENVAATMADIYKRLLPAIGVNKKDTALLGSTGKKNPHSSSGDIDLAVSIASILEKHKSLKSTSDVLDYVYSKAKTVVKDVRILKGIGIVTMGFPVANIDGKQENQFVQCDLMLTSNLKWSEFIYFSPYEKDSIYKGAVRNSFFSAISHYAGREGDDVEWSRSLLHFETGLHKVTFSRKGKKSLLKNGKETVREFITKDPQGLIDHLIGPKFSFKDIMSFEDIWKAINSKDFLWSEFLPEIKKRVVADLLRKGIPIPPEVTA